MKKRNSNYTFAKVPSVVKPRSVFDRSRTYKSAFNAGVLIPFYLDEILPGDTIANLDVTAFARLSTPVVPFMDNLWMDFHFFFVPNRLVWDNWQRFCGEQDNPDDSTDYLIPQVSCPNGVFVEEIGDYFGLPIGTGAFTVNALPFRCYCEIWNQFFRDENLQDSIQYEHGDTTEDISHFYLLPRGKRKCDPFTSALPWPQKGPGVELSISGYAPVGYQGANDKFYPLGSSPYVSIATTVDKQVNPITAPGDIYVADAVSTTVNSKTIPAKSSLGADTTFSPLFADLTATVAPTINSLREAFQIQRWYEQLARGGSRYQELLLSMFGTDAGDARLQRPEYLGGGTIPIQVHAVAQTSGTAQGVATPQGNLAAFGVAGGSGIGFSKSFVEHGYVLGLVSVRADYTYQQGLDRIWSRQTKFDFYWPAFAHLGEVGILNKELYLQGGENEAIDNQVFGYQERWYDYRYGISKITGMLRSTADGTLDFWHLAQKFDSLPTLAEEFIVENPPVARVLAVQSEPHFIFDSVIKCRHARVMPTYSVPGLIDHF